jgi:hypothetical protein
MAPEHRSILIAGAGTTGFTAALELARRGFRPRIVDNDAGPVPMVESRALGVNARTLTLLGHRVWRMPSCRRRSRSHSSGLLPRTPARDARHDQGAGTHSAMHMLAQGHTERLLLSKLDDFEVDPEWQTTVETVSGDLTKPVVMLRKPDGSVETADVRYRHRRGRRPLGNVRKAVGIGFPGAGAGEQLLSGRFPLQARDRSAFRRDAVVRPRHDRQVAGRARRAALYFDAAGFRKRIEHPAPVADG